MARIPTNRKPTHPGEMLLEEFLLPLEISQKEAANAIDVPYQRLNEIVNGRRSVTPSTALRLGKYLGTSAGLWLNLQTKWDLYHTQKKEQKQLQKIKARKTAAA